MTRIRERISSLNITVESPDRTVRATLTAANGIRVAINPRIAESRDEDSLAAQIEAVLVGVVQGSDQAAEMIRSEARDGRPPAPPNSAFGLRRHRLDEEIDDLDISASSPGEHVVITWLGKQDFVVVIRPGTLGRLTDRKLTSEINTAILAASHLRSRETAKIYKRIFGHDRFAKRETQ